MRKSFNGNSSFVGYLVSALFVSLGGVSCKSVQGSSTSGLQSSVNTETQICDTALRGTFFRNCAEPFDYKAPSPSDCVKPKANPSWYADDDGSFPNSDRPVCLGLASDIDNYLKNPNNKQCVRLKLESWNPCENRLFIRCAIYGLLPGQSKSDPIRIVTLGNTLDPAYSTYEKSPATHNEFCMMRKLCSKDPFSVSNKESFHCEPKY